MLRKLLDPTTGIEMFHWPPKRIPHVLWIKLLRPLPDHFGISLLLGARVVRMSIPAFMGDDVSDEGIAYWLGTHRPRTCCSSQRIEQKF